MKQCVLVFISMLIAGHVCAQRNCASFDYQQQQLQANPLLAAKMAQAFTRPHADITLLGAGDAPATNIIKIPVVVHVLYNTPANNISDAQIKSQIEVLNRDFRRLNADTAFTPAIFRKLAADCQIEFELAKFDPKGRKTNGIVRKASSILMYGLDDRIKYTGRGGSDAWDADNYLNIWVGTLAGGLLGYASVIGGDKAVDGVAIAPNAFGTMGTAAAPFNKGRTATHEIGHWLGLIHLWGDQVCGDDQVDDTPRQRYPTRKCPTGVQVSCSIDPAGDMYNNFMDFTDDACLNLFTHGQRARMRSLFDPGGPRYALLASKGMSGIPGGIIESPAEEPIRAITTDIKLYPSPAVGYFLLEEGREGELLGKQITITNRFGQKVMQQRLTKGKAPIYIGHLPDGLYFVTIEGERRTFKLMKGK